MHLRQKTLHLFDFLKLVKIIINLLILYQAIMFFPVLLNQKKINITFYFHITYP